MRALRYLVGLMAVGVLLAGCSDASDQAFISAIQRYELSTLPQLAMLDDPGDGIEQSRTDTPQMSESWAALGTELLVAQSGEGGAAPLGAPGEPGEFVHWMKRRGPAYPGDFWRSVGRDGKEFGPMMWHDTLATAKNPLSLVMLAGAGITGIVLSGNRGNDQVADHFTRHGSQLNTFWDTVGDVAGNPGTHFGVAGAMYVTSLARGDTKTYEVSKTLLSALALNGLATMGLKVLARTESPNGDEFGWPSGHTSSTFCLATVMHEAYGPWVGVPLFILASYVGYERIDARNHDFADVISGALIGIAIGHAVSQNHEAKIFGMDVLPYTDPQRGAVGLMLTKRW